MGASDREASDRGAGSPIGCMGVISGSTDAAVAGYAFATGLSANDASPDENAWTVAAWTGVGGLIG